MTELEWGERRSGLSPILEAGIIVRCMLSSFVGSKNDALRREKTSVG